VYCEGRNTEPRYITKFAAAFGNGLIEVRPVKAAGVPKTLVAAALLEAKAIKRRKDSFERGDEVWVAFDCDEHEGVPECLATCRASNIGIAYSNPCIEEWAIIHFEETVSDAPISRHDAQRKLERLMKGYDRKNSKEFDYEQLSPKYGLALKNAEALLKRRQKEGDELGCPCTTFHQLTERIRTLGNPGKAVG
jgi:hypothetical protein